MIALLALCALSLLVTLGLIIQSVRRCDGLLLLSALAAMLVAGFFAAGYGAFASG